MTTDNDRKLWRRLGGLGGQESRSTCPAAETLAAYLDDRLSAGEVERVEHHLASCGNCLTAVMELRSLCHEPPARVPERVLDRAKALVVPGVSAGALPSEAVTAAPASLWSRWRTSLSLAAAAAAVVLSCWAGLRLGGVSYQQRQQAGSAIASHCCFGLGASSPGPLEAIFHDPGGLP